MSDSAPLSPLSTSHSRGAVASVAPPAAAPVPPVPAAGMAVHPAATLMLLRGGEAALEVLMLRRHPESVFAADAWVFPGGRVDPADGVAVGPADADASRALGLPSGGLAFWVAAARECFEEAGILLARHAGTGDWLDTTTHWGAARLSDYRAEVHAGRRSLVDVLAAEDLVLDLSDVHYVSHWITPPGGVRRFDTRFFVAPAPSGQVASHDRSEMVESVWTTPTDALARHAAGEVHLVFPTIKNLQALARFPSASGVLRAARSIAFVPSVTPRFRGDPDVPTAALEGALLTGAIFPPPASLGTTLSQPEPPCPT